MGNNIQGIWKEAVNANLTLYFLLLGTSPLTVIPTTTNRKELVEKGHANLTLYFLLLGTSPLTVIPTTTNRKELVEKGQGRKGEEEAQFELISKGN